MRDGINWTTLCPATHAPQPVEQARATVLKLRDRIAEQRTAVEAAKRAIVEAEQHDREQMAAAIRRGGEPRSETAKIEKLRSALGEAERKAQAIAMAVDQAEAELGTVIEQSRGQWARDVSEGVDRAREQARKKLDELTQALDSLRELRGVENWLARDGGFDSAQGVRGVHVGHAPGSRSAAANSEPFNATQLLGWLAEVVDPPAPPKPIEHRPMPAPAFPARGDASVEAA